MLDYSVNKEEQKDFILSYKVKKDKIIIKPAKGRKYSEPYSYEKEQEILSKMENQINNAKVESLSLKRSRKFTREVFIAIGFLLLAGLGFLIPVTNIFTLILVDIFRLSLYMVPLIRLFNAAHSPSLVTDLDKNKFIYHNKGILNQEIKKDPTLKNTVSRSMTKKINSVPLTKEVFDVNFADRLTLKEYKKLRYYLEHYLISQECEEVASLSRKK